MNFVEMDKRKITQAYVRKNPEANLQTKLHPRRKKDMHKKRSDLQGRSSHVQENTSKIMEHGESECDLSCRGSRSNSELSNDIFFDTPKVLYQEKAIQQETLKLGVRENNDLFYASQNPFFSNNPSPKKPRMVAIEDENICSSKNGMPNDLEMLRMQLEKQ